MKRSEIFAQSAFCVLIAVLFAALALPGCGGGASVTTAGGGTGGTGLTTGSLAAFGSVIVNGVEFKTGNAVSPTFVTKKFVNGEDRSSLPDNVALRLGMVIAVHHAAEDNNAAEIVFLDNFEGPVAEKNPADNTFVALGQVVLVDGATNFFDDDGGPPFAAFADIGIGNVMEVSGLPDSSGVIHATLLERKKSSAKPGDLFEIKGYIANVTASTFTIGPSPGIATVMVDFAGVLPRDLPPAGLVNGLFVEIKTASTAGPPIAATRVEVKASPFEAAEGDKVSFEGFPANIVGGAAQTFTLNGVPVAAAGATFSPGGGFSNITTATKLEVNGVMTVGVLHAARIVFE